MGERAKKVINELLQYMERMSGEHNGHGRHVRGSHNDADIDAML